MKRALLLVGLLAVVALVLGVTLPASDQQQAVSGPQGEQGLQGERGPAGPRGPAGTSPDLSGVLNSLQSLVAGLKNQALNLGAAPGPKSYNELNCVIDFCTWTKTGRFLDATTSLAWLANPFNATATAELRVIEIFGLSTSTVVLDMGTSTSKFGGVASTSRSLLNQYQIATGTLPTVLPGMTTGALGATSGYHNTGIATSSQVVVGKSDYVNIFGTTPAGGDNGGVIGTNNTFQGKYVIEFQRLVR